MCSPKAPYLTLQGMSSLGPGHLQVLRQSRELVALCPVVMVAGEGLGLPGVDQMHHVQGQVALGVAAGRPPPVLKLALQLTHLPAVLEPGVVAHAPGPDQPASLLHKVMSVEKLQGRTTVRGQRSACLNSTCAFSLQTLEKSPVLTRGGDDYKKNHSEVGLRACFLPGG